MIIVVVYWELSSLAFLAKTSLCIIGLSKSPTPESITVFRGMIRPVGIGGGITPGAVGGVSLLLYGLKVGKRWFLL